MSIVVRYDNDILRLTKRVMMWLWLMIVLIPSISGISYLIFRCRRKEVVFLRLQTLARQHVWNQINQEIFEKKLKELKEKVDAETRERIDEYIPHIVAFERVTRAREEMEHTELQR